MPILALLRTKPRLALVLTGLFIFNYLETQLEEIVKGSWQMTQGFRIAEAFQQMEGGFQFAGQALAPLWSIAGFSLSYFVVLPLLMVGTAVAFWRRQSIRPFRVFSLALTINYFLSLPFFLFFPVPERWAYPGSTAILMSDLLSTRLIELIRPISGLDNCFPSIHVSFSLLVILSAYRFGVHWRHSILFLALTVVLSTFALGIHWGPDILLGTAMAGLGFALAIMVDRRLPEVRLPVTSDAQTGLASPELETVVREVPIPDAASVVKAAFISYRRDLGSQLARIVQAEMDHRGVPCFLDVEDLGAEQFDNRLLKEIEQAPNFILILTPGALERCVNEGDWLRSEIVHALEQRKNIVPLLLDGFRFPDPKSLPAEMRSIERYSGVTYSHEYFAATFDKLRRFMKFD